MDPIINPNSSIWRFITGDTDAEDARDKALLQIARREGVLYERLCAIEAWAKAKLRRVAKIKSREDVIIPLPSLNRTAARQRLLERRDLLKRKGNLIEATPRPAILADYLAYRHGNATPEAIERIKMALADTSSELYRILKSVYISPDPTKLGSDGHTSIAAQSIGNDTYLAQRAETKTQFRTTTGTGGVPIKVAGGSSTGHRREFFRVGASVGGIVGSMSRMRGTTAGYMVGSVIGACVSNWINELDQSPGQNTE